MSDIEAAEAQVEKDGVAEIIREYVSDYDVIAFAKREPIPCERGNQKHSTLKSM
jgi:hypothetical protein